MLKTYDLIKSQLQSLNRKEQYKLLLETKEWSDLRERLLSLGGHSCKKCNKKEGPIEEEIMSEVEWLIERDHINAYNRTFLKWSKDNPHKIIEQLIEGTYQGQKILFERFRTIGYTALQIHHKLYFWNKLPWEYDSEHLIPLCSDCHLDEHRENKIYLYWDESKKCRSEIPLCQKCGGSGYLPEFYYNHDGICFQCNGGGIAFSDQPIWVEVT